MALQIEVGHFTQPGGTGDQTVSLVDSSLTPVAVICWVTPVASAGIVAHASMCIGFGTMRGGSAQNNFIACFAEDNVGTADTYRDMGTDRLISLHDGAGAEDMAATLVSFGAGQFVVNWSNLHGTASIAISYMVFGGDDVLDAESFGKSYTAATGAEDITLGSGMGHPDVVFFARTARGFAGAIDAEAAFSFGWGVRSGSNNGRGIHWTSDDAATTEAVLQRVNNNIALQSGAAGTIESAWTLAAESGWPTDGFEINKSVASFAENFVGLAIRFSSDVTITTGQVAAGTSNGSSATLTSSGNPRGALIAHVRTATANTSDTSSADCGLVGVGAIDDQNHEQWRGIWDDDGQATASVASSAWTNTKSYRSYTPNNDTLVGEADGSVSGSDFLLSFNDGDTIANVIEYITFGEAAGAQDFDLTPATETDSAVALTFTKTIFKSLTAATETDSAMQLIRSVFFAISPASETDSAVPITFVKPIVKSLTAATETDEAQAFTFTKTIFVALAPATEADTAQALSYVKPIFLTLTPALETDEALLLDYDLAGGGPILMTLTPATETDAAQGLTLYKSMFVSAATETDAAQALTLFKSLQISPAVEADAAQALALFKSLSIAPASEADAAQALTKSKNLTLGVALEADTAVPLVFTKTIYMDITPAQEFDVAVPVSIAGQEVVIVYKYRGPIIIGRF